MVSFDRLAALERSGAVGVVITVVDARGSTPRKAGARMVVLADGASEGTVGGGAVELRALEQARELLRDGVPRLLEIKLGPELGMCCGGSMRLYLEPLASTPALLLLGGGHVARACAAAFAPLGFSIHVADERDGVATAENFPGAASLVGGLEPRDLDALPFGPQACVLVATHDHALDHRTVERCLRRPFRWLGLIASKRKALKTREHCLHRGLTLAEIARLRSPVGLDVGAQTPAEIAVSIAAEIIHLRRRDALPGQVASLALPLGEPQPTDVLDPADAAAALPGGRAKP